MIEIIKSVFWVGSATVFNLLVWVVAGKVMALVLGPAGVGMYGLLRQLSQNLNVISTFNGSTTLVQGLASRPEKQRPDYAKNVAKIFLGLGVAVILAITVGGFWLSPHLLGSQLPPNLLKWMVIPVIGMSLSSFFVAMLNGYRHIKALVICQALGPLTALVLIYPAVLQIKHGGYWAYAVILGLPYAAIGLSAAVVTIRKGWFVSHSHGEKSFVKDGRHFFGLSTAFMISGAATTGLQLFINWIVLRRLGLAESGQFWVAWSLSVTYITVLVSSFGAYYLPSLSSAKDYEAKKNLILTFTRLVLLILPLLITMVIIFKGLFVSILFSRDLLPSLKVFRWTLLGDFFKVLSWVWAFPMLAYAEGKRFIKFELATNILWGAAAWFGFRIFPSIEFLGQLFCLVYILYAAATLIYLKKIHAIRLPLAYWWCLLRGFMVVLFAAALFWKQPSLTFIRLALAIIPAVVNLWASLSRKERQAVWLRFSKSFSV